MNVVTGFDAADFVAETLFSDGPKQADQSPVRVSIHPASVPIINDSDFVFTFGHGPVGNSRHYPKKQLDEELKKVLPGWKGDWVIHDLSRLRHSSVDLP